MWSMWNLEQHYYLAAGSDNHNVWKGKTTSGSGRSYVYLKDGLSEDAFIDNLTNGHSFATFGPLVYPDAGNMYGNSIEVKADTAVTLKYQVQAVSGIKHIQLVERGQIVKTMDLEKDNVNTIISISFNHMPTNKKSWYSVMVEDMKGNVAVTNPVWVNVK